LHLDCCFQSVSGNKAIIDREAFRNVADYNYLVELFGIENSFHISREEMSKMYSNIFSIDEEVVISEKSSVRLNNWLKNFGITVEEVGYLEIGKQNGLIRCPTLPLCRG